MALNFPIPTSVGQVYQDPTSGNTYVCTSLGPPAQWVGSGSSTSLDSTYLRTDASNDPVTGNLLLNPTTNVSPLTLQQPVGNTTPALKIENSGSGNSIEANGFAVSETGVLTLGTALAIASGGTGATTQSAARTNLGATTVGNAVFTAVDEAAARTNLGATTVGNAVFTAVDEAAGRLAIGAMANTAPEIITNANGTAYRWPNGLQICTGLAVNQTATTVSGSLFVSSSSATWTFPAVFSAAPACFGHMASAVVARWYDFDSSTTTLVPYQQVCSVTVATDGFGYLMAIGTYTP